MNAAKNATRQKWEGRWDQLVGRARKLWGQLTEDDFTQAKGDYERLVGLIKERTGQTREKIEESLGS